MDPKNNDTHKNKSNLHQLSKPGLQDSSNMKNQPVLILLRIMTDEQTTTIPILKNLSTELIKFIRFHLPVVEKAEDKKFQMNLHNLMEQVS